MQKSVEARLKEKKIYQVINSKCVQAGPDLPIRDAITFMQENKSGYLVIAHRKKLVGMFTETDVLHKVLVQNIDWTKPVRDFINPVPASLMLTDSVMNAIDVMSQKRLYHIPLVDEKNQLVGVISVRTLIRFLAEFYPTEVYNLPPDPAQVMETQEGG